MEFEVHTFRRTVTLSMPVSGAIERVPAIGEASAFPRDSIRWSRAGLPDFDIVRDEDRSRCIFRSDAFLEDADKLLREEQERLSALNAFRGDAEVLSGRPVEDPFFPLPQALRDRDRVREAEATLVSLLLSEQVTRIPDLVPEEPYPLLEDRIKKILSPRAVGMCASLVGFTEADTMRLACTALAQTLRLRENIKVPEVENPSSPFQTLAVNDTVLMASHTVTSSIEAFEELVMAYVTRSRNYWASVATKKLYNANDIEALKAWKIIQAQSPLTVLVETSPQQKLDDAWAAWRKTKEQIVVTYNMVRRIGTIGMGNWLNNTWPPEDEFEFDFREKWVAREAARQLGYPPEVAEAHLLTWKRLGEFVIKYFLLDFKASPLPIVDTASRNAVLAQFVVAPATDHLISTQMEFEVRGLFGGTRFRQNFLRIPEEWKKEFEDRELGSGVAAVNSALRDPRNVEVHMSGLRGWRSGFEEALSRQPVNDPRRILGYYESMYEAASEQLEAIRTALANVASVNELRSVIRAMVDRMNSGTINVGAIDLPPDMRVTSVFVKDGEYIAAGRPVLSACDRFRCNARAFLSSQELGALPLSPMSVWTVAVDGKAEAAPGVQYIAIVGRVEPEREDRWVADIELCAVLAPRVEGVGNLPDFLPLSQRYLGLHGAVTESSLEAAEASFSRHGTARLELLGKVH